MTYVVGVGFEYENLEFIEEVGSGTADFHWASGDDPSGDEWWGPNLTCPTRGGGSQSGRSYAVPDDPEPLTVDLSGAINPDADFVLLKAFVNMGVGVEVLGACVPPGDIFHFGGTKTGPNSDGSDQGYYPGINFYTDGVFNSGRRTGPGGSPEFVPFQDQEPAGTSAFERAMLTWDSGFLVNPDPVTYYGIATDDVTTDILWTPAQVLAFLGTYEWRFENGLISVAGGTILGEESSASIGIWSYKLGVSGPVICFV